MASTTTKYEQANEEKFRDGVTKDKKFGLKKALSAIFMNVTDSVIREIAAEDMVAWKKIKEQYLAKTRIRPSLCYVHYQHPKKPFVDSMLYGKEIISLDNVSNALK
ncbi:Retrovirus-related Pol polyprotein from transposon TNT 1-94 [Senna tora]|uniref:Retrovirus-related Pol polyprotein from transposon TNT 1-94 n=1 Tax=Senna tora TaxID=362788 RepID=A0A834T459_9FABA|nr:Retrovirus-related Pol polyprotein from transposon TNT 1-94 [Senna tora]